MLPKVKGERKGRSSTQRLCRNSRETACPNVAAAEDGRAPVFGQNALTSASTICSQLLRRSTREYVFATKSRVVFQRKLAGNSGQFWMVTDRTSRRLIVMEESRPWLENVYCRNV